MKVLVVRFNVTGLTDDEVDNLIGEVVVQGEASDDHPEAPALGGEVVDEPDEVCAAEENGMSKCDDDHKARGVACGVCDDTPMQESSAKKAAWLDEAKRRIPVGSRVLIRKSDVTEYIGTFGEVIDYDLGLDGSWPLVCVKFDSPIVYPGNPQGATRDAFYCDGDEDDEIMKLDVEEWMRILATGGAL